ncbi:PDZ domain-containing protein [Blastopirellula retiformator]|uniref:Putative zinc metalloprotease n=1 Tax=Blastopirellula retiformator TaxID=2527970 RepID=A0A5C5VJS1_9BACT|nr:PDZ domain-containing protein [Blastopirellula retiformator]TWT38858.1 putative zinc metalloprotease [Blastopirellula retiformator]
MKLDWYSKGLMLAAMAASIGGGNVLLAQEAGGKVVEAKPLEEPAPAEKAESLEQATDRYWIGAKMAAEMPSLLKRHVPQLADKGVFVEGVFDGSPAAEAGLEAEDVVLELNGQPMTDARTLVDAVREGEGKSLKLVLLHNGQEKSLEVTPRKLTQADVVAIAQSGLMQGVEGAAEAPIMRRFIGPGQVMPQPGMKPQMHLMDSSSGVAIKVRVSREGDGPAMVHVEHDGKTYDVDAEHLNQLPPEVRTLAKRAVESGVFGPHGGLNIQSMMGPGLNGPMMQQQLQEIRQMLEEMKSQMRGAGEETPQPPAEDDHAI